MPGRSINGTRRSGRSAIVILADGARADVFERMLAAGDLPEIARHVVERGGYRRGSSTFTSTTIPAHLPILAGQFAGTANVPGYRWFERGAWRRGLPLGPWCLRSYNGPESALVNRDIAAGAPTLFELTENAVNVFGVITRGLGRNANLSVGRKNRLWLKAHYRGDFVSADEAAREVLVGSIEAPGPDAPEFRFAMLPGIDWNSHYISPFSPHAEQGYRRVDRTVGAVARRLQRVGGYDETLIVVCSDHGHCPVDEHFDLPVRLESDHGLRVAYHSLRALRRDAQAIACVSGNAMAHVYVRGPGDWGAGALTRDEIESAAPGVVERLIGEPAVDVVISRRSRPADDLGSTNGGPPPIARLLIESRRGRATLSETAGMLEYRAIDTDPFGFPPLPERMTHAESLELTFNTGHPDALLQIAQIFRSPRTGDLVVSAAPGYDLRDRFEHPEHLSSHGALHDQHMHIPLAISAPVAEGPVRTADIFATTLGWLGRDASTGVDGVSRLVSAVTAQAMQ